MICTECDPLLTAVFDWVELKLNQAHGPISLIRSVITDESFMAAVNVLVMRRITGLISYFIKT